MKEPLVFSHVKNNKVSLVDITEKRASLREAIAESFVLMPQSLLDAFAKGDVVSEKGPIVHTATIAGIMAAKQTPFLIPLTHTLNLTNVVITISVVNHAIRVLCRVNCIGPTGAEMEALTGATIAALTIYDMCKSQTHDMEIIGTKLIKKSGGKHEYHLPDQ